jgi:hypothetical protein
MKDRRGDADPILNLVGVGPQDFPVCGIKSQDIFWRPVDELGLSF